MNMKIFAKGSTYVFKTCDKVIIFFHAYQLAFIYFLYRKKQQNMVTVVAPLMMTLNAVIITFLVENIKKNYEQIDGFKSQTNIYCIYVLLRKYFFIYLNQIKYILEYLSIIKISFNIFIWQNCANTNLYLGYIFVPISSKFQSFNGF